MRDKRFQKTRIVDKWGGIYDSETDKVLDVNDVEHKLNEQQATINELQSIINHIKCEENCEDYDYCCETVCSLYKEIKHLKEENEQLKKENEKLGNIHLSIDLTYSYGYGRYLADVRVIDDE